MLNVLYDVDVKSQNYIIFFYRVYALFSLEMKVSVSFPLLITAITAVVRLNYADARYFTSDDFQEGNIPKGFDPNRYIVVPKNTKGEAAVTAAASKVHLTLGKQNAISISLSPEDAQALRDNSNILSVNKDPPRFNMKAEPSQRKGSLLRRAVLQTTTNSSSSWHHDQHRQLEETVPYGIDLVQARDVTYNANTGNAKTVCIIDSGYALGHPDLPTDGVTGYKGDLSLPWDVDGDSHGSHVAGTIAALGDNGLGVIGVAPGVNLFIVRVFGDDGNWAYASDLIDALDQCDIGGADIVSMSLGCTGSFNECGSSDERNAFDTAYANGMLLIAAAGNSGTTENSYPASYDGVVSVAALDSEKALASFSQRNDQVDLSAPGVAVLSTAWTTLAPSVTIDSEEYIAARMQYAATGTGSGSLEYCGLGDETCTGSGDFVCLIERGEINFSVKVQNCENGGGKAAIIFNNEPGDLSGTLVDYRSEIPAVSISQADGQFLFENMLSENATVTIFSEGSYGYEAYSGTSMATPHVSGVAALVWSNFPQCTAGQIRNTLATTAMDLGPEGRDDSFGFGLVQAKAAVDALSENGCGTCRREWPVVQVKLQLVSVSSHP
jgi:serine protease